MENKKFTIQTDNGKTVFEELIREFEKTRFFDGPARSSSSEENLHILWGEKYYYRNKSRILATMILHQSKKDLCNLEIVLGGGSHGVTMTLGAEKSLMKKLVDRIQQVCIELDSELTEIEEKDD